MALNRKRKEKKLKKSSEYFLLHCYFVCMCTNDDILERRQERKKE